MISKTVFYSKHKDIHLNDIKFSYSYYATHTHTQTHPHTHKHKHINLMNNG